LLGDSGGSQDWDALADQLRSTGPEAVVITLGSKGALFKSARTTLEIPAPPVVVVDSTGAGDAFTVAFAAAIARGEPQSEAAKIGVVAGSLAVTKQGAQPSMPTLAEIQAFLAKV